MKWYWLAYTILPRNAGTMRGDGGYTATKSGGELTLEQMLAWREKIRADYQLPITAAIVIDSVIPMVASEMSRAYDAKLPES